MEGFFFIILYVGLAIAVGFWAGSRGRSAGGWAVLSLVTSPLLGAIILGVTRNLAEEERVAAQREDSQRREHERQLESIKAVTASAGAATKGSVADELMKLTLLRQQGALTEEEFASQKARLLNQ